MGWGKSYFLLHTMLSALTFVSSYDMSSDELARLLEYAIDINQDPCENFYDYVCGNWNNTFIRPEHYDVWDNDEISKDSMIYKIKTVLEDQHNYINKQLLSKEKAFYHACMDTGHSFEEGKRLYKNMVRESQNAGPEWQDVAEYYANKIGEISLFHITLGPHKELQILRPSQTISNSKPYSQMQRSFLDMYLNSNASYMWYNDKQPKTSSFKRTFKNFLSSINKLVYSQSLPLIPVTIERFQKMYEDTCPSLNSVTKIDWLQFLQQLSGGNIGTLETSHEVEIDWSYLKHLCEILSSVQHSVIVRYLQYNFEANDDVMYFTSKKLQRMNHKERSYSCILKMPLTEGYYNVLAPKEYISRKFSFLLLVLKKLQIELIKQIGNSWLDDGLKEKAMRVAGQIKLYQSKMNFPIIKNEIELTSYTFEVTPVAVQNWLNYKKAQTVNKFNLFLVTTKGNRLNRRSKRDIEMNAFYMSRGNIMVISLAFLFPPLFYWDAPVAYNFGRIGFIIGHEISHAFDYTRFLPEFGYQPQNLDHFNEIMTNKWQCFENQFDQLNDGTGGMTAKENYADTQGLKLAFKAMRRYFERFCESRKVPYSSQTHSPAMIRVIGTLQNMKEFAETFNCKIGSPMNPLRERCDFWEATN
ncbi:membrane metallo-endopeptidase-like 1 isoform X3 [Leptopilina heterotoma]|uniref:membrane metallo-endopeptidase-like 1 isoform X3 n=1 Tax=Leptopilina heterotoma TaxID=63436 RepID=UPI001CA97323|nr:membrane metallo-endopeptidase-like 1 isoform X3 [Leptopilina heterotoma]